MKRSAESLPVCVVCGAHFPVHCVEVGAFTGHGNPNFGHLRGKFSWAQFLFKEAVLHRALRQDPRAGLEILNF